MKPHQKTAARRAHSYWLLSRFYLEPVERPLLEELQGALRAVQEDGCADSDEYGALQAAVDQALARPQELYELQAGFARLLWALVPQPDFPDHVGAELRMMSSLCASELQAWRSGSERKARTALRQELRFLDEYVMPCLPGLRKPLAALASHAFGPALMALTEVACRRDRDALDSFLRGESGPLLARASRQLSLSAAAQAAPHGWGDAVH
jgi:TorA maturation chaperone TorD